MLAKYEEMGRNYPEDIGDPFADAFPALAAELRRLWGEVHDCPACGTACVNCRCVYDELARLRAEVAALHAQLQAQAYVVPEGAQLVVPPHVTEVGYVLVRGGHVAVQEGTQQ